MSGGRQGAPLHMSAAAYRAATVPLERVEQVAFHGWCRQHVSAVCFHARNEGRLTDLQRIRAVAEGMLSGVADEVGIIEFGPLAGRMFGVELKRQDGTASDVTAEEWRFGRMLQERGGIWSWQPGAEAAKAWCYAQGIVRPRGWVAPWVREPERHAI